MSASVEVGVIHSRAIGALFFGGFGSVWLYMGLSAMHPQGILPAAAAAGVATALILPAVSLLRQSDGGESRDDAETRRIQQAFIRVNIVQWVAAATLAVLLNALGKDAYVAPVIAAIVGLHLFPLARLYRNRLHYVTGSLLVGWSLACVLAMPAERIAAAAATGAAIVLLGSAAFTLVRARAALRP